MMTVQPEAPSLLSAVFHTSVHLFFAAIGALVLYMNWGRRRLKPYLISELLDHLSLNDSAKIWLEFCTFIMVGCIFAVGMTHPSNSQQSIAAGLGWTGLAARPNRTAKS
jgi:hypothetical protein